VVHRNAPLTETGRLRLARCVVEDRWPIRRAANRSCYNSFAWRDALTSAGIAHKRIRPYGLMQLATLTR
jgi:leucine-zipper of insertion element IS481